MYMFYIYIIYTKLYIKYIIYIYIIYIYIKRRNFAECFNPYPTNVENRVSS